MTKKTSTAVLFALVLALLPVGAQTVCIDDSIPSTGTANAFPFGQTQGCTYLAIFRASQLSAAGVCGGAALSDISFSSGSTGSGTYSAPQAVFAIGNLLPNPIPGAWLGNFGNYVLAHDLPNGPFTFPWTQNTFSPFPGVAAAGFVWDGVSDLGVYFSLAQGATGTFSARRGSTNVRHYALTYPAPVGSASSDVAAIKFCMTFVGGQALYQVNQPAASFTINGVQGSPCRLARPKVCLGLSAAANFSTSNGGLGFELISTSPETALPVGAGGIVLPSGQIFNINAAAPSLNFLNGLTFPPLPSALSVPISSLVPFSISAQLLVLDPASLDGFALSQPNDVEFSTTTSIPGPALNDSVLSVPFASLPCLPSTTFSYYGTSFTQVFVGSNGRIMFGTSGSTSAVPSITTAQANPATIGAWCNLDPNAGGSITVSGSLSGIVRVQYQNVPFASQPGTSSSFAIELDVTTGNILFDGLLGMGAQTGALNMFLGISRGTGATLPSVTTAFSAPFGTTANSTDMIFEFGLIGTLAPGRNQIAFIPNGFGNFDWF